MYKGFIRPILFLLDAEKVHHLVVVLVRFFNALPFFKRITRNFLTYNHPILETRIGGLLFKNKVGLAAGFDKNADFFEDFSIFGFSFIEIGTVTPVGQPGNPKPRLFRLRNDKALINRMGFNNKGVDYAVENLKKAKKSIIIGGNIGKNTATTNEMAVSDYEICFAKLYDYIDYFAVNVSCPNIKDLGKLQDQDSLRAILNVIMDIRRARKPRKPVFLKISPDLTYAQIDEIIQLYDETGLDGIIATNTTTDRECLLSRGDDIINIGPGGLSGYPLKKRSLEVIRYICKQSNNRIPVIGVGGIINSQDAVDMIDAGATLVQVYTGFIYDGPFIVKKCNKRIARYLIQRNQRIDID